MVAQEVNSATGTGLLLPTGLTGITCDINSSADTSVPAETFTTGSFPNYGTSFGSIAETKLNGNGAGAGKNPKRAGINGGSITTTNNPPQVGDTATAPIICDGGIVTWYRLDPSVEGGRVYLTQGPTYTMVINDVDYSVYSEVRCPDSSSPTGYGQSIPSQQTAKVAVPAQFTYTWEYGLATYSASWTRKFDFTAKYWCNTGALANAAEIIEESNGLFPTQRYGIRVTRRTAVLTYVCSPPATSSNIDTLLIEYKNNLGAWVYWYGFQALEGTYYEPLQGKSYTLTESVPVYEVTVNGFVLPPTS